jgi:hypothetical protein
MDSTGRKGVYMMELKQALLECMELWNYVAEYHIGHGFCSYAKDIVAEAMGIEHYELQCPCCEYGDCDVCPVWGGMGYDCMDDPGEYKKYSSSYENPEEALAIAYLAEQRLDEMEE